MRLPPTFSQRAERQFGQPMPPGIGQRFDSAVAPDRLPPDQSPMPMVPGTMDQMPANLEMLRELLFQSERFPEQQQTFPADRGRFAQLEQVPQGPMGRPDDQQLRYLMELLRSGAQ
jgi:hypothetical protein